jgi:two-component system, NarL family, sensor histidine kinase BarA
MFKRIRQMKISLAAKCQILFGSAVALIILAALYVPWQRMEQLMDKLNLVSARTATDAALAQHISTGVLPQNLGPATRPATRPTTQPAVEVPEQPITKLMWLARDPTTMFEKRAFEHFAEEPAADEYVRYYASNTGYRYAARLRVGSNCLSCHSTGSPATTMPLTAVTAPTTTMPSLTQARPGDFIGVITVDMKSGVEYGEQLLNRVVIITAGVIAGVVAIIVFYRIISQLILQPVRVLQETAEKVSQGDLNIRSDISTGDEFQQLSETLNTMLTNLKTSADQLRAINKALDTKLGQLAETNVALYESNRLKSEFLANVSHELRTPLNSILGFAELLKDVVPEGKNTRYIQNILQSGKNLLELINDLLDLAKIEAGRMEIRSEPTSLADLFEGLGGILKPLLAQKELTLETQVGSDVPIMQTDPAKLQQVLYNLLSNAIKFSPKDGRIDLTADRDGEQAGDDL